MTTLADLPDIDSDSSDRLSKIISSINGYAGQGIHFNLTEYRDDERHQSQWRNKGTDGLHVAVYHSTADLDIDDPLFEVTDAATTIVDQTFFVMDGSATVLQVDAAGVQIGVAYPLTVYGSATIGVDLTVGRDVAVGRDLSVADDLSVTDATTIGGTLGVTGTTTLGVVNASGLVTLSGAGTALAVTNNATIGGTLGVTGTTTLGVVNASGLVSLTGAGTALAVTNNVTIGGTLVVTGATTLGVVGIGTANIVNLNVTGNTALGDANTDVLTVIGTSIFKNAASSAYQLYVDAGNNRVIAGSATTLGSDTTPNLQVVGRLYVAPESANDFAMEIRRSSAATVGWDIGVTSTNDLVFKDDSGTETFRIGDVASTYQAKVTGQAQITNGLVVAGGATISTGNLAVTTGGVSAGASSTFTGGVTLTNSILTLTGGQIAFPATQVASADANTLDDYEEGSWTPALTGSATYTTQVGRYTKIGRLVTIHGEIQINAIGSSASTSAINGLPFTAGSASAINIGYWATSATAYVYVAGYISGTTITLYATAAAAASLGAAAFWQNAARIVFEGSYSI